MHVLRTCFLTYSACAEQLHLHLRHAQLNLIDVYRKPVSHVSSYNVHVVCRLQAQVSLTVLMLTCIDRFILKLRCIAFLSYLNQTRDLKVGLPPRVKDTMMNKYVSIYRSREMVSSGALETDQRLDRT